MRSPYSITLSAKKMIFLNVYMPIVFYKWGFKICGPEFGYSNLFSRELILGYISVEIVD